MEAILKEGQKLDWHDEPFLGRDSVHSVLTSPPTGSLYASRPLLPVLSLQACAVKAIVPSLELLACLHFNDETQVDVWTVKNGKHTLCIKFYCEYVDVEDELDWEDATSFPERSSVIEEARAYEKLQRAQGSIVPWSYGFYKFTLAPGQTVIGHVMEYLSQEDGFHTLDHLWWDMGLGRQLNAKNTLCIPLLITLIEIHRLDVASVDLASRNIRVRRHGHTLYFTIFDFGNSCIISEMGPFTTWDALETCSLQEMLFDFGIHNARESWFDTPIGAQMLKIFETRPSNLAEYDEQLGKLRTTYIGESFSAFSPKH